MAKTSKSPSPFEGRWRITSMVMWSLDVVDAEVEGFVEFGPNGLGSFHSPMSAATSTTGTAPETASPASSGPGMGTTRWMQPKGAAGP
jgi:hypothetical protein